ncbi:hypothetical protein HYZ97_01890 [Candidatus Pacearchaeota archaeon]|nr:hypothetical protein [Candidatus Pacearchaeota archaeon]
MDESLINVSLFNTERIAQELYAASQPGVMLIPGFLSQEFCERAMSEFRKREELFHEAPHVENTTRQELKVYYCGEADGAEKRTCPFQLIASLRERYSILCKKLGERAGFQQGSVINSIGIHWYAPCSCGMGTHRDYSKDINLLSMFALSSTTPFNVYADKQGTGKLTLPVTPGSLVLMRGPRCAEENEMRPYHSVDRVLEERFSVLFRQKRVNGAAPGNITSPLNS